MGEVRADAVVARFRGTVRCAATPGAPYFTLSGTTPEGEPVTVTFAGSVPEALPETLDAPLIEAAEGQGYLIREGSRRWAVAARAVHVHRELPGFYSVIEPQVPPLKRRLLWSLLMALAARPLGLALLRRLRGL